MPQLRLRDQMRSPVDDLKKYSRGPDDDNFRHRMMVNLLAFGVLAFIVFCGIWLANTMSEMRKNQDCVLSGRTNCAPIRCPSTRLEPPSAVAGGEEGLVRSDFACALEHRAALFAAGDAADDQGDRGKAVHAQGARRRGAEINHPSTHEWAPVVDTHDSSAAVAVIDDGHLGPERQVRCAAVMAPGFICSPLAVRPITVDRRNSGRPSEESRPLA